MSDDEKTIVPKCIEVGGTIDEAGAFRIEEVSVVQLGYGMDVLVGWVEGEKFSIRKASGSHAAFLLLGKTRYRHIACEFFASDAARFLPAKVDERQHLEAFLGLTIVIDPRHEHRMEVIGPVSWEAFR